MAIFLQQPLPEKILTLSHVDMENRIRGFKSKLGKDLLILGHHYQQDEVIQFADYTGDSLKLSQLAAQEKEAKYIVFCGVHFMAETADILTSPGQTVILPDLNAGCSMADMADLDQVEECWDALQAAYGKPIIPITYVNSTADIKAFCGRNGGLTCTSSNARQVFDYAISQGKIILFLPDEHLGRNTGYGMGITPEETYLWNPLALSPELPEAAPRLVLWNGFCSVHQKFQPGHIDDLKSKYPGITILVHPECDNSVVENSDLNGSTDFIIRTISNAPGGSSWAVGTELNLVNRLANQHPDKRIISLNPNLCLCTTMNRIDTPHLLWVLENLTDGVVVNQISVDPVNALQARAALDRMLSLSA